MPDLSSDPRTKGAYRQARKLGRGSARRGGVDAPPASGPAAQRLLGWLAPDEVVSWVSWGRDHTGGPDASWWLVAVSNHRLLGLSPDGRAHLAATRGDWVLHQTGPDAVLTFPDQPNPLWLPEAAARATALLAGRLRPEQLDATAAPVVVVAPETPAADATDQPSRAEPENTSATGDVLVSSWQEAETLAAWHMARLGFDDAKLTQAGADGGIDVAANSAVAQVKHYAAPVGSPAVQQLRGAAHGQDWALFYALSGYTRSAIEYADAARVALFSYTAAGNVVAVNEAARFLSGKAEVDGPIDVSEYELQHEQRRLAQRLFDETTELFFVTLRKAMALAQSNPSARDLLDSAKVEARRVEAAIAPFSRGTVPMSEAKALMERVLDATARLMDEVTLYET